MDLINSLLFIVLLTCSTLLSWGLREHLALEVDTKDVSTGKEQESAGVFVSANAPWLGPTSACCCKVLPREECRYKVTPHFLGGHPMCCKVREGGCPWLSTYETMAMGHCLPQDKAAMEGMRNNNKYQILQGNTGEVAGTKPIIPLGVGTFGVVLLASDKASGKWVAIKAAKKPESAAALQAECKRTQDIHERIQVGGGLWSKSGGSLHVMECLSADPNFDPPFIALEYAGTNAWEALAEAGPRKLVGLLSQVFKGLLAFAESKPNPQMHHDLKWENVAVNAEGCLKLIDLDSVRDATPELYNAGAVNVLPQSDAYTPPEWFSAKTAAGCTNQSNGVPACKDLSLWHNFECGPNDGKSCPWAHSFDMYSAGVMTVQTLCGTPEWYYALLEDLEPNSARARVFHYTSLGMSPRAAKYKIGYDHAMENILSETLVNMVPKLREHAYIVNEHHEFHGAFESKLQYCEQLQATEGLQFLDSLRAASPGSRPHPALVLSSPIFSGLTGCSADSNGFTT